MQNFKKRNVLMITLLAFLAVVCMVNLAYAKTDHEIADEYYEKGLKYGSEGNFKEAEVNFKKALEVYNCYNKAKTGLKIIDDLNSNKIKKEAGILLFEGINSFNESKYDEALDKFNQIIIMKSNSSMPYYYLGVTYEYENMYDKAIEMLKKAILIDDNNDQAHECLGYNYIKNGLIEEGIVEYKKAISINPYNDNAHYGLGKIYEEKGIVNEAISEYKKAIESDPRESEYYYMLDRIYKDNNMTDKAAAEYKKIISLNEKNDVAHGCLAQIYEEKGMEDEAVAEYKKAIELNPEENNYYNSLLPIYIKKKDYKSAVEYYNKAIKNNVLIYTNIEDDIKNSGLSVAPRTAYDFYMEGLKRAISGDFKKAEESFKESYKYWKDVDKLNDCLKVIESLKKNNVKKDAAICFFKGVFYEKGDKAVAEFEKAAAIQPDFALPYYYLGNICYKEDKLDKSLDEYKKFVSLESDDVDAHRFLGLIYYKKNMPDEAIAEFKKCLSIDPDFLTAKINLIAVYVDKGLYDEAMAMANSIFGPLKWSGGHSIASRICALKSKSPEEAGVLFEQTVAGNSEDAPTKKYLRKLGEVYYYYNKAVNCGADSDFKGCKENLEKALKIEKNDRTIESYLKIADEALSNKGYEEFATHIFRGILYYLKGMDEDIYIEMWKATKAEGYSDSAEGYGMMVMIYFEKFKQDKKILKLNGAVLQNPDNAEAHYELASAYYMKGLIDEAISEYKKAIAINPNNSDYHSSIAGAYASKDMLDEAIVEYKKALDIKPGDINLHTTLAKVYHKKGMFDDAISEYKKDISISGGDFRNYYDLACVYRDKGMLDESIDTFKKALKQEDYAYIHYGLAEAYYAKGDYQLAIKHCDEAVKQGYSKADPKFLEKLKPYRK